MPKEKESKEEISDTEAMAPLFKSLTSTIICCHPDCGEGHCCDERLKPNIISFEELLKETPKDPCIECTDDKTCFNEAGMICEKDIT